MVDVPFAFLAHSVSAITAESREEVAAGGAQDYIGVKRSLPHALIATQTCDLRQDNRVRESPFINVVTVYDALPLYKEEQHPTIRRGGYKFLVPLDGSALPQDGTLWVADLRIDVLVDRAVLLNREPKQALTDAVYVRRCRMVGTYRGRPALSDDLIADHITPLETFVRSCKWRNKIDEAWVQCEPNTLDPAIVYIFFLTDAQDRLAEIERDIDAWFPEHYKNSTSPIQIRQPKIKLISEFNARDSSIEIEGFGRTRR